MFKQKRIFVDINIIMDLIDKEVSIQSEIVDVLMDLVQNEYEILTSSETITTIYHIASGREDQNLLTSKLKDILRVFKVVSADENIIYKSLEMIERNGGDFEDRLQYLTALHYNCEMFLTNRKGSFPDSPFEIIEL